MKIREFQFILEKKKCDFALFYNSDSSRANPNMFYFSGYRGIGALIVPQNKNPLLIVPEMEFEKAKKSIPNGFFACKMEKKKFFESIYKIAAKNIKSKNIAIDNNNFTLNSYKYFKKQFRRIKTKDISVDCSKLRQIKTEEELEFLKKSCTCADKILRKAISNFSDFKTESEAAAFLEYETRKSGLELSFNPIIACAGNASMPHHEPSDSKIKKGFCVMDFGVKYKGYCSDITRTIYVGSPGKKEKDIYNFLLEIQKNAINEIKENKKCSELYDFVNKSLGKHKDKFTHGLGHGVGVEIHELPNLTLNSKDRIKNSMAFTIEPGIYFAEKFGIRIEDTVAFKDKTELLTKTTKDLITK